jgi:hypothetical protein
MRKNHIRFGTVLIVMAVLLFSFAPATAAEKTEFTCVETPLALLDPGAWSYPDGNVHVRGMVELLGEQISDPHLVGENTIVLNANWRADMTGPVWGTFRFETTGGGWEGTWAGQVTGQGTWYNAAGKGFGEFAGMKMWVHMRYGDCSGEFLED